MDPRINVEFQIKSSQIKPEEITSFLGINPTRKLYFGDFISGSQIRMKTNMWCFSVDIQDKTLDLSDYISPIITQLLPKKAFISKLCQENEVSCVFECGIHIIEQTPIVDFSPKLLSSITELNANLDIDIILTA